MNNFVPKWEKSFVVVNKEQRTGMVCYCFSVVNEDSNKAEELEDENSDVSLTEKDETGTASKTEVDFVGLLNEFNPFWKFPEEVVFDHFLWTYKGHFDDDRVGMRLLHKNGSLLPDCGNCSKKNSHLDKEEFLQIAQSLSHPFLVPTLATRCDPTACLVIVPLFKKSVKEIIESRLNLRLGNDGDARFISACLTDAVMYLHGRLIIHRNICPYSVYINDNGDPVLGNFEQSTHTTELGIYLHNTCGTIGYQSPEVVAQLGYNHTVDYWGIGCVAYEFLFGIMPYVDADVSRMLSKTVLNPDFAITRLGGRFSRLPKAAQEALRDCFLNRYPHKRIGFKQNDAKQLRWFQPFRWDMIRNREYKSPLKKFIAANEAFEENQQTEFCYNSNQIPKLKSPTKVQPNKSSNSKVLTLAKPSELANHILTKPRNMKRQDDSCISPRENNREQSQEFSQIHRNYSPHRIEENQTTQNEETKQMTLMTRKQNNVNEVKSQTQENQTNILPLISRLFLDKQQETQPIKGNTEPNQQHTLPIESRRHDIKPLQPVLLPHYPLQAILPNHNNPIANIVQANHQQHHHYYTNQQWSHPNQQYQQIGSQQQYYQPIAFPTVPEQNLLYSTTSAMKTPQGNYTYYPRHQSDAISRLQEYNVDHQQRQYASQADSNTNQATGQATNDTYRGFKHFMSALQSQAHAPQAQTPPVQHESRFMNMFGLNQDQGQQSQEQLQNRGDNKNVKMDFNSLSNAFLDYPTWSQA